MYGTQEYYSSSTTATKVGGGGGLDNGIHLIQNTSEGSSVAALEGLCHTCIQTRRIAMKRSSNDNEESKALLTDACSEL
jgi:hypothetical protein